MKSTSLPLTLACLLGLFLATSSFAQLRPYVVDNENRRIEGTAIRSGGGGKITLTLPNGKTLAFAQGGYRKLYKPMPAEFKRAVAAFNNEQYATARPMFESIEKGNRYLNWDFHAGSYLVKCYIAEGKPQLATQVIGRLMAVPGAKQNAIVVGAELEALIGSGKADSAGRKIDQYVSGPSREVAAIAQTRRGDISMSKNLFDQAVLDYLRTVAFFEDVDREIQAEAMFKTGLALKKMKDSGRAQMMFQRTQKNFPGSYWALRAQSGK